jgi:hypothetical protein
VKQNKTMSTNKSLSEIRTTAVKVEVVSTCVWSHTAPTTSIDTYEGTLLFVRALLSCIAYNHDAKFTSIFVTTRESGDWMYRRPLEANELLSLGVYQFFAEVPAMMARAFGIHSRGFFKLRNEDSREAMLNELTHIEVDFNQSIERGLMEYRSSIVSSNDKVVEQSSTAADVFDPIDDSTNQNS